MSAVGLTRVLRRGVGRSRPPTSLAARYFAQRAADFNVAALAGTADGASISSWASTVGSYTATQSGTNRPTYSATGWSDGTPCISAVAASKQAFACDALTSLMASGHAWGVASLARRSGTNEQILFGATVGAAGSYQYGSTSLTNAFPQFYNNGTPSAASSILTYSDSDSLIVFSYSSPTLTIWCDGYVTSANIGATNFAQTKAMILSLPYNGIHTSCWNGKLKRQIWYGRGLANHDYAAIEQSIGATYTRRVRIVIWGNSRELITTWPADLFAGTPPLKYWHDITSPNTEAGWHTYAVSGYTSVDILNSLTSNGIASKYDAGRPMLHLVCDGPANDAWVDGVDGATAFTRNMAIHQWLATNCPNDMRVAFTVPQRNDQGAYSKSQVTAAINGYNTLVRANWSTYAHALVDVVATNPKWLDPDSDFYSDHVHFSAAGNAAFASAVDITALAAAAQSRSSGIWLAS